MTAALVASVILFAPSKTPRPIVERLNAAMVKVLSSSTVARDKLQGIGHEPATTDDLGRYRIYGLEPGEYVVAVEGRSVPVARAAQPGVRAPLTEQELMAFLTTFHPSTLIESSAQHGVRRARSRGRCAVNE